MIFNETEIKGVYLIEPEFIKDERGYFARTFCENEFKESGIVFHPVQSNVSNNKKAYTLRGMHFHAAPYEETKLVRCSAGKVFDVVVDIRSESPSFRKWLGVELSRENGRAFYIPTGCAHGFLTLENDSEVFYQMGPAYTPGHDRGFRWNDPTIDIDWPGEPKVISARDAKLTALDEVIG